MICWGCEPCDKFDCRYYGEDGHETIEKCSVCKRYQLSPRIFRKIIGDMYNEDEE